MNDLLRDTADGREFDLEAGPSSSSASGIPVAPGQDTTQFFQEVNDVTSSIAEIRNRLLMLQNSNEVYRTVTRATVIKVIMDEYLDEIRRIAGELQRKLEALNRSNSVNRRIRDCQAGSSTDRARMSITSNLKRRLRELTVDFQALGQRFHDDHREVVVTRLFTVTGQNFDESVIERLIETGDSEQIFQNAILAQGRGEVLDTIAEIQERHDAVKDIERKLLELHQIFLDMGILVEAQGELVDNIEAEADQQADQQPDLQVDNAFDDVSKCICISLCLLVLVAIIVGVAVLVKSNHRKRLR